MASASSPCHRLLPPSSSPSLDPCSAVASASHPPDLPFSMTDDQPASPPSAADGSSPPVDDPRPSPPPAELSLRKTRFPRACTSRSHSVAAAARPPQPERRPVTRREKEEQQQTGRVITPLLEPPLPPQLPRWELRSMWELASIFNFLHIFRPLLNIAAEFSAEELETALLTASSTLDDVHMPLLKAIPPVTRMALGRTTWVTVLCRKLRDWWHWVAEGEIPIVASHGTEIEKYRTLQPGTRVLILKALCDIRVEQEDIRNFIDSSLKHGIQLSAFRKERIGGDSHGISYWYEDDPIVGHRLYREIRRVETKNTRAKGSSSISLVSLQWETVATNLDEFQEVSDKLFSSKNRTEVSLGKKLKIDSLPEIERIHKKKEKLLKKQQREAILLDSFFTADGISSGRSLRDRKPVTYTFDDYDRSISEAIKITKRRQSSPDTIVKKPVTEKPEITANGKWNGSSQIEPTNDDDMESPKSNDYEETDDDLQDETLDRSNRRRKRPQRYSEKDFVDTVSDFDADMDSDDDIVGEAVYDEEYLRSRKQRKVSSGSEGDEEYRWEEENAEDEEEEEYSLSTSEDMDGEQCKKSFPSRTRQDKKLRSVELQTGLRRSKRAVRSRINYRQYELSDTDTGSGQPSKSNRTDANSNASGDLELSTASQDSHEVESEEIANNKITSDHIEAGDEEKQAIEKMYNNVQEENGVQRMRFLDLNELAPGTGLDDGPTTKDEDEHNF
ncbi:DDT domain-containing protein DDR4-like isoform X1 [Zingiber officinale]|uniref:DDT domain-containing protein DDR4-like isoform X1 n=1 Tax=Zingiber officinale TaxID=94328 RepID=UPI001C4AF8C7|nr:DDT domain-containing protein DDR4-like isoform X1 [Zingiber officinale]XP_042470009.1 DDT domain-containing protein DDR4-like isoform X1 [Zingiber officinale]XP_042470011.1 DDT domain-containing protein DDR4-like isoform X1 [Zingiber officinale]XP_042470012.1 DDT domain-containing protein DDR4-like isoform X1 [Zingiber officinale]XP_042470013.1 DDT domain-containing protein DDR4-like isoform X1 [Zingiber officinale]XP_042470014.1 DDT domain-containing protein DDR4-like isoform X1 [Zingiber